MSRLPAEVFLALRYLRPKRTFISAITLISVVGVAIGVWALIVVIAVMTGFDRETRERILGFNAHLRVTRRDTAMTNFQDVLQTVTAVPGVKGVAPFLIGQVLVKSQPEVGNPLVSAPWVRGMDLRYETNVSVIATSLVNGTFDLEGHSVLVGSVFARNMHVTVGDRLSVYSPRQLEEMERRQKQGREHVALAEDYTIRGILDVGYFEYNANFVVTSLENAQDLYALDGLVHGLLVTVDDPMRAGVMRWKVLEALGDDFWVSTWVEENMNLVSALAVEKNVMFITLFVIMIVAAFGIMGTLIAFVVHKTREIGILKALGGSDPQVMALFLIQSFTVGALGIGIGFAAAKISLAYRNEFLFSMRRWTGLELFPASIYSFTELPALLLPRDVAVICGSALLACLMAGVLPAIFAARLQPVEALRHE
jgi:lipoprotein-releasing system permease protein